MRRRTLLCALLSGLAGYTLETTNQNGTVSRTSRDEPVEVTDYDVSPTGVTRQSGVGDRTGTLVCW